MKFALVVLSALLAGCSLAPNYAPPTVELPAAFRTAFDPAGDARWKPATPGDALPRGTWWTIFDDPILDTLQADALAANQELAVAAANLRQSRAESLLLVHA